MIDEVDIDQESKEDLKEVINTAGEDYKVCLQRLTSIASNIENGHIQSDTASEFLNKYKSLEKHLKEFKKVIEETKIHLEKGE